MAAEVVAIMKNRIAAKSHSASKSIEKSISIAVREYKRPKKLSAHKIPPPIKAPKNAKIRIIIFMIVWYKKYISI